MKKRGYLQISFAWLFAIIVGAFILFLAIYAATKLMGTEQATLDAKTGKEIGILLNPLETGFETAKVTSFTVPVETRIYNKCDNYGMFGRQIIQISQKSFNKWTETEIDVGFSNKYIFSEKHVEGKKFYIFSKPFDFPFKVADLIYMFSSNDIYCFADEVPEDIEDEISDLEQKNLLLEDNEDCEKSIQVCFGDRNCEIYIDYDEETKSGYVEKDGKTMHFEGDALMYAAVFADPEIYERQLKRLMKRTGHLALLYEDKSTFISQTVGCHTNLNQDLFELSNSDDFDLMVYLVNNIKEKNEANWECRLW